MNTITPYNISTNNRITYTSKTQRQTNISPTNGIDKVEKIGGTNINEKPTKMLLSLLKGALNDEMKRLGCNKVAYAHHKDDVIDTMLLSLLFEGKFTSFLPKTYLDRVQLTVIRPLIYVDEADVIGFVHKYNLPVAKSPCPVDGSTKREYADQLLKQLICENKGVKERLFSAIENGNIEGWQKGTFMPK